MQTIIMENNQKVARESLEQEIQRSFKALDKLLEKENADKGVEKIAEGLLTELEKNRRNNFLGESLKILHEMESKFNYLYILFFNIKALVLIVF